MQYLERLLEAHRLIKETGGVINITIEPANHTGDLRKLKRRAAKAVEESDHKILC